METWPAAAASGDYGLTGERSKQATNGGAPGRRSGEPAGGDPQVSRALRTAYEETVKEDVPAEFLDLLNKLS